MKMSFFVILAFCLAGLTEAQYKEFDYRNVLEAGTGRVGDNLVRYLVWSEDHCIVIQNMVFGGSGKVSAEKKICSLEGKRFSNDYAEVDFKKGSFEEGRLFLDLEVYPLRLVDKVIMTCEVVFNDGVADHLSCKEKLTEENCTCNS